MKKLNLPIQGHRYPKHDDNACPICGVSLGPGQVVLMLTGGASLHNHFKHPAIDETFIIAEDTCDIRCCSKTCMENFLLDLVDRLEPSTHKKGNKNWYAVRLLWIEFDPIGVLGPDSDCPSDEYDSYVQPTLRLLEDNSGVDELKDYISYVVKEYMGMDTFSDSAIDNFANKLLRWYADPHKNSA